MGKLYATDGKILSDGFPELKIGDKCYRVDTRKATYDKMQEAVSKVGAKGNEEDLIVEFTLGKEALKEIKAMELSVAGYMNLIIFIQAAIFDISFEEAQQRFQKAQ